MWGKITMLPVIVYFRFVGFVQDLKQDERGLSNVVTTVLLILVGVLLVVLVWGFLSGWLEELWERITSSANEIG